MKNLLVVVLGVFILAGCAVGNYTVPDFVANAEHVRTVTVDRPLAETYAIVTAYQDEEGIGEYMRCELKENSGQCTVRGNRGYLYYVNMTALSPNTTQVDFYGEHTPGEYYKTLMNYTIIRLQPETATPVEPAEQPDFDAE